MPLLVTQHAMIDEKLGLTPMAITVPLFSSVLTLRPSFPEPDEVHPASYGID
jgi:hypothetical protein